MKKNKSFIGLALVVAILVLGIGYALSAIDLNVNGDVAISPDDSNFAIEFTNATVDGTGNNATIGDGHIATLDVKSLKTVGDTVTAVYTITNKSNAGLSATLTNPNVTQVEAGTANDYYTASAVLGTTDPISVNGTTTLTVTVKLIKAPLEDVTGKFTVSFKANAVAE